ncbi:hypothetical protein QFC22_000353 [Naganishia vaughanmartiniae]|uniref:Uncharacterized protein n=1 Tax=Naganishia vaughanmartiniae TaxID=1424756 RepID=A0ACC2XN34_9TREE|nr:hypothetical protein QFC22_000353 [Naganishia vaughanmartiniae]
MPVVRSEDPLAEYGYDIIDPRHTKYQPTNLPDPETKQRAAGNATGTAIHLENDVTLDHKWREKTGGATQDEGDYTRLRLMEDEESEEVHLRTKYLFNEDKAMTPLSQMQATKELLTEGQRIAYVGLCALIAREMIRDMGRGWVMSKKEKMRGKGHDEPAVVESGRLWMLKIMARLYQHMDLSPEEQRMIESLAEHGVTADDLVPALMTTHTIDNPEYDPNEAAAREDMEEHDLDDVHQEEEEGTRGVGLEKVLSEGSDDLSVGKQDAAHPVVPPLYHAAAEINNNNNNNNDNDEADIADLVGSIDLGSSSGAATPKALDEPAAQSAVAPIKTEYKDVEPKHEDPLAMGKALPGVSTTLSKTDKNVTLDIRWTVLCDLFLQLIGDSVYDSRSRVYLERVAERLGLTWMDVTRFEKRVTDALEIQEGVEQLEQDTIIEDRQQRGKKKRYAMMGLATLGGGLVIGLSAGLLAPVIGAGLGAAFATVGITGTTGFLAGAGGAAVITTGGVLTGGRIAGKGMARRTRNVGTFEFKPIHNNKRVNCFITVPGFMSSLNDDVRLPFSTLDSTVGDVFSVLWEPEMMNEMGNALKILTTEVLTQVGQTVLAATAMTALLTALQWPLILTKLGYLIDNPWSNALDRSWHAGQVLADVLISRHAGVRPISLIGFSLGARAIFYALEELAKRKAYGIVQDVYLFGATVTAPPSTWLNVRSVIAGKFVNAFATSDWLLGYLFRFTSGGLNTVAGLRPVEGVPGLENVDVTDKVTGHLSYRSCMPALLEVVGLPITADWFDEPDDPYLDMSPQDDAIAQQEAIEKRKDNKGVWRMFRKNKVSSTTAPQTAVNPPPSYTSNQGTDNKIEEYVDDSGDITSTIVNGELGKRVESDDADKESDLPPATVGFDFKAIGEVLGKDVDPASTKRLESRMINPVPTHITKAPAPLERSESAPPLSEEKIDQEVDSWNASSDVQPSLKSAPHRPSLLSRTTSSDHTTPIEEKVIPIPEMTTQRARQFPSHVLKSAASIFNANPFSSASSSPVLPETTAAWNSAPASDHDASQDDYEGDIGGDIGYQYESNTSSNNRISEPAVAGATLAGWSTDVDKAKSVKDDWALNNPW